MSPLPFLNNPQYERTAANTWCLTRDLVYQGKTQTFTIPTGFCTDLASVPTRLESIVPKTGKWDRAAIVHDWLCVEQANAYAEGRAPLVNSHDTDGIFIRIAAEDGTTWLEQQELYVGVSLGAYASRWRRIGRLRDLPRVSLSVAVGLVPVAAVVVPWVVGVTHLI